MESAIVLLSKKEEEDGFMKLLPSAAGFRIRKSAKDSTEYKIDSLTKIELVSRDEPSREKEQTSKDLLLLEFEPSLLLPNKKPLKLRFPNGDDLMLWHDVLKGILAKDIPWRLFVAMQGAIMEALKQEVGLDALQEAKRLFGDKKRQKAEATGSLPEEKLAKKFASRGTTCLDEAELQETTPLKKQAILLLAIRHMLSLLPKKLIPDEGMLQRWVEACTSTGAGLDGVTKVMGDMPPSHRDIWKLLVDLSSHLRDTTRNVDHKKIATIFVDFFGQTMFPVEKENALKNFLKPFEFTMDNNHEIMSSLPKHSMDSDAEDSPEVPAQEVGSVRSAEAPFADTLEQEGKRHVSEPFLDENLTLGKKDWKELHQEKEKLRRGYEKVLTQLDETTAKLQKMVETTRGKNETIEDLKREVRVLQRDVDERSQLVPAVKLQAQKAREIVQKCGSFRTSVTMQKLKEMPLIMVRMPITATTKAVEAFHHAYPGETDSLVNAMDNMASLMSNETLRSPKTLVSLSVQAMLLPVMASVAVANVALGISKGAVSKTMSTMSSVSQKALLTASNALSSMAGQTLSE